MRILFSTLLIALLVATCGGQSVKLPFSIDISGPKTVKAGVPIEIKVVVTNTSDQRVDLLEHTPEEFNYRTEVFNNKGQLADNTGHGHFMATNKCDPKDVDPNGFLSCTFGQHGPPVPVSLSPTMKFINWIPVTEQFRMQEPGDYSIVVSRSSYGPNPVLVKSNTLTVTVTP